MSALPAAETGAKRRIGDILLAHGFVTAEQIADATAEQERTQQPLGQILVGRGAITRLELASALAEQWSDPAASITSTAPRPAPTPAPPPSAQDEAQYAARLQDAVADLARKVQSNKPLEDIDDRVEELSRRIEGTLARTQHIEAAVATLAESLEGVTTGVEEAFYALQSGTAELAEDLVRIDRSVAELAAREHDAGDGRALAEIEELRSAIAGLGTGGGDPELHGRVEDLVARIEHMESSPAESHLRGDVESQARTLDDLRSVVEELRERPTGAPDLDERLGSIESRIAAAVGSQEDLAGQIGALAERVSEPQDGDPRVAGVIEQLGALDSRLKAAFAETEGLRAELARQDDTVVDGRLDDLAQTLEVLRGEIADVAAASTQPDRGLSERLDELGSRIDGISGEATEGREAAERVAALEERLRDGFVTPDVLTRSIEWALGERPTVESDERVADILGQLDVLRSDLGSLSEAAERRAEEVGRLDEIEARLQALAGEPRVEEALNGRLDALEHARAGDLDTVEVLARAMDRMRHELAEKPQDAGPSAEAVEAMTQLALRIEALEAARENDAMVVAPGPDSSELVDELERVRLVLERIGLHLGEHDRAIAELSPNRGLQERLDDLTALVQGLAGSGRSTPQSHTAEQGHAAAAPPLPFPSSPDDLLRRVEEAEVASQSDNEKLMSRLERMASSIDWRLQRLETEESEDEPTEENSPQ